LSQHSEESWNRVRASLLHRSSSFSLGLQRPVILVEPAHQRPAVNNWFFLTCVQTRPNSQATYGGEQDSEDDWDPFPHGGGMALAGLGSKRICGWPTEARAPDPASPG
jgi:hypothetical protein